MAEQLEGRVKSLEDNYTDIKDRVGNLETAQEACMELQTERHTDTKEAIKGVDKKLTALILMLGTAIVGALLTLVITLAAK